MSIDPKRRTANIPVEPYIYKWLLNYRKFPQPEIWITADFAFDRKVSPKSVENHFSKKGMNNIKAYMRCPNKFKAYYLYIYINALFDHDIMAFAVANSKLDMAVMPAIEQFLRKCRITEQELKLESAYKRWQRSTTIKLPGIKPYTNEI